MGETRGVWQGEGQAGSLNPCKKGDLPSTQLLLAHLNPELWLN